ncbi:MAG TPA: RNA polymerase sigma factor [Casimicrobiaceae bacterium]|nr:RNA polymerase sigma factor [Casimicrobiaceae bacterium]
MPNAPAAEDASDADLLRRVRGGAPAALQPLYRRHGGSVYRFALLWSGSPATAADVTQDVFVHLLTHPGDFDPSRGRLSAYLCGIARNFVRRQQALPVHDPLPEDDGDDGVAPLAHAGDAPLERLLRDRELERLRRAIALLPPPYREALILVELQECSYAEAAAQCGCALGTIRSRLSRARALVAGNLGEERDDAPAAAARR